MSKNEIGRESLPTTEFKSEYYQLSVDDKIRYHLNLISTELHQRYDNITGTSICLDNAKHLVEIFNQLKKEDK